MDLQLKSAIQEYFKKADVSNTLAVTLTMKQKVDSEWLDLYNSKKNFKHFMNRMNERVYGNAFKRFQKRIGVIPIIEFSQNSRLHYHLIMERPERISDVLYPFMIDSCWGMTKFGHHQVDIQKTYSSEWIDYITKFKSSDDQVDWDSFHWNRWL
jgi:glutaredoxin-related protein